MLKFFCLLLVAINLSGCRLEANNEKIEENAIETYYPITIKNYASNRCVIEETFIKKPERVVAHHQNIMEVLMAIDEEKTIIGAAFAGTDTRKFSDGYQHKVNKLPKINEFNFDLETVLMYRPDLIIGWQSTFSPRVLRDTAFWHKRGVNTYIVANSNAVLPVGTVEDEYTFLNDMGIVFNHKQDTDKLIAEIKTTVDYVQKQVQGQRKQRVLILEFMGNSIITYDKSRLGGDMIKKLGGELVECGHNIDAETLIMLNPDVIFMVSAKGTQNNNYTLQKIYGNRAFRNIKAVKNKRVYYIPLIYMYASGTRTIDGIRTFRDGLYPEMKGR